MAGLFTSLNEKYSQQSFLNPLFQGVLVKGLDMIGREQFKKEGFQTAVIEQMNEIIQYCDYKGLQEMIFNLGKAIIEKIVEQMGHFQSGP